MLSSERPARRERVAVVGYNLKFIDQIVAHWRAMGHFDVRVDEWPKFAVNDPEQTADAVSWADTVVCEWCGPNAVYASRHKRPDQRLVIRLHRFELATPHWRDVDIEAVDVVVAVGPHYARLIAETTGWQHDKIVVVPNLVDDVTLHQPKLPSARFGIGLLGAVPARKRLDRAIDVIEGVRTHDPGFTLFVKSEQPSDLRWVWNNESERSYFEGVYERLEDTRVGAGVVFDTYGPDVAAWFRKIGFLLSVSDDESFHLAPAEAMASGTVPLILPWPGARELYDETWLCDDVDAIVGRILALSSDETRWREAGEMARRQLRDRYGSSSVLDAWDALVRRGS